MFTNDDQRIQQYVCYIFANLSQTQNREEVLEYYYQSQIVKYYIQLLKDNENNLGEVSIIECLDKILELAEGMKDKTKGDNVLLKQLEKISGF